MQTMDVLVEAIQAGEKEQSVEAVQKVITGELAAGDLTVDEVIEQLTAGMREVGDRFARLEIFLPEMMIAAEAMKATMKELEPEIKKKSTGVQSQGSMVIGTIDGDMHEIGKDIVTLMLRVQGFEVYDLGCNVNALDFVRKAQEIEADIIGVSALMTTTMPGQKDVADFLNEMGLRDTYHLIVGGAPVTQEWVDECRADSWGKNAGVSVDTLERVMKEKRK